MRIASLLRALTVLLAISLALSGCGDKATPRATVGIQTVAPSVAPTQEPPPTTAAQSGRREIVIVHTNDEHGQLQPEEGGDLLRGGAGYAAASWREGGLDPRRRDSNVLLLSGGDNWVGPAISTWFKGESTIEAMNAMGYRASAVGNHEFDFGQDVLRERGRQATFPYLAANLIAAGGQRVSDLVQPYVIVEVNDVKVGIVGLALKGTPRIVAAKHVEGLSFGDYEPALRKWIPLVRKEGAQVIIVESHLCPDDLVVLANQVQDLGIALYGGGHCHQSRVTTVKGVRIGVGSSHWRDYVVTRLVFDLDKEEVIESEQWLEDVLSAKDNLPGIDVGLRRVIDKWRERVELALGEPIGYTQGGLRQESTAMHNLLVDSWLWGYPQADVAISNVGGFRDDLCRGEITMGDVVGVFPFDNDLYDLTVKGSDILSILATHGMDIAVGGIRRDSGGKVVLNDGTRLDPAKTYRLLTTDYMYGKRKYGLAHYDPEPYPTSILWRQPVIDWITAQRTTPEKPVEGMIDDRARM